MIYGVYQNVRDSAWLCLRDYKINKLPVDVLSIARIANVRVIKNSAVNELKPSESGFSCFDGKQWYIVYDDKNSVERNRFTIAHELGHIFLGHKLKKGYVSRTKVFVKKPAIEKEADMFAARILCPSCVLWALNLNTAEEIARVCRVSYTSAQIRAERMTILYERQKFLTSPLEREVYKNFEEYIKNSQK